jgi:PleD family two-component response regulator
MARSTDEVGATPPLILLANHQEWAARSLESVLGPKGFAVVRAYTGREALRLLRSARPDAVILHWDLPDISGIDLCRLIRGDPQGNPGVPIVALSAGTPSRADRLEAYKAGAWELLGEPYDVEALALKLDVLVGAKREADRLVEVGLLDPLTGAYNARGVAQRARELGAEASRRREALSCIAFSATVADAVVDDPSVDFEALAVRELSELCRGASRVSDALGRLGRVELVLIAPGTGEHGAQLIADRVAGAASKARVAVGDRIYRVEVRHAHVSIADFSKSPADAVSVVLRAAAGLRGLGSSRSARRGRGDTAAIAGN